MKFLKFFNVAASGISDGILILLSVIMQTFGPLLESFLTFLRAYSDASLSTSCWKSFKDFGYIAVSGVLLRNGESHHDIEMVIRGRGR
jgi:hypothetical protein